jgi:pyruvate decarboxylase
VKAAQQFSIADAQLMNKNTACSEIDRVLTAAIIQARPAYLAMPTDIVYEKVPSGRLNTPLSHLPPPNDPETEEFVIKEIVRMVKEVEGDVIILVDACTIRHYVRDDVEELVKKTGFPVYSAPMGKTAISEENSRFGGVGPSPVFSLLFLIFGLRSTLVQLAIQRSRKKSSLRSLFYPSEA